ADDTRLARIGQRLERVDVARAQCRVFAVEQGFEFSERAVFVGQQPRQGIASQCGVHGYLCAGIVASRSPSKRSILSATRCASTWERASSSARRTASTRLSLTTGSPAILSSRAARVRAVSETS